MTKITDKDGFERVKRSRRLGQNTPEIRAVEAGKVKDLLKKRFCGDECSREMCDRWSCKEKAKTSAREVGCAERVVKGSSGEVIK